ncbi:MAG: helix-turn-helix domain-containing protein [Actinomycetota bacterium]|nr:helix-turn-helix domain-containing protein [Actinomycetota bacterium]
MDLPDSRPDVLAQPTRSRIFALLVERKAPVGTDGIAAGLGLHVNGVRRHLELLVEAGLVERRRERGGRGRPGDRWVVAAGASPGGEEPTAYADLAVWLARAIPAEPAALRRVEEAGREIGRDLGRGIATDPARVDTAGSLNDALATLGFRPRLDRGADGSFTCHLDNCPYMESAAANRDVVCGLHRGMTAGLLERIDADAELTGFEPHDPREAGCVVKVG